MKNFDAPTLSLLNRFSVVFLLFSSCTVFSHEAPSDPPSGSADIGQRSHSLCATSDTVVFSCPLAGRSKIVSLCAGTSSGQVGAFHYVYGRPFRQELVFPSTDDHDASPFRSTHLTYGGATGGTAYSFVRGGYKYIVYSISGTGYRDGGVLVQKAGSSHAISDMKCRQGAITESEDDAVVDATMKWGSDPEIQAQGLPRTGK